MEIKLLYNFLLKTANKSTINSRKNVTNLSQKNEMGKNLQLGKPLTLFR